MNRNERVLKRDAAVNNRYQEEYKKGYRDDIIFQTLGEEFYLSPWTIESIVTGHEQKRRDRVRAKKSSAQTNPNQLTILDQIPPDGK